MKKKVQNSRMRKILFSEFLKNLCIHYTGWFKITGLALIYTTIMFFQGTCFRLKYTKICNAKLFLEHWWINLWNIICVKKCSPAKLIKKYLGYFVANFYKNLLINEWDITKTPAKTVSAKWLVIRNKIHPPKK